MEPRERRTTAPRTIRRWVEAHGGYPAELAEPRGDEPAGALRIVLPDTPPAPVRRLDWPTFFERLAAQQLALVYWDTPAGGAGARLERREERARPARARRADQAPASPGRPRAGPARVPRTPPARADAAAVARAGRGRGVPRRQPRVPEQPPPPRPGPEVASPEPRTTPPAAAQRAGAPRKRPVLRRAAVAVLVGALRLGHRLGAVRRAAARRGTPAV